MKLVSKSRTSATSTIIQSDIANSVTQSVGRTYRKLPHWAWLTILVLMIFSLLVWVSRDTVHADSQGPLSASSTSDCVENTSLGTQTWTSPGNAFSVNTTYATVSVDGQTSHYIACTNFGFSITSGSTINGVVVNVTRKSSSTGNGGSQDAAMRLIKGGTIGSTDRSTTTTYTTSDVSEDHGGTTDLWGTTLTSSDVNASNFGAAFAVQKANSAGAAHTVSVDAIRITVYYTLPPVVYGQASYRVFNNQDASAAVTFANAWGSSSSTDNATSIAKTSDGGYVTTGDTGSFGAGGFDAITVKYDASGNEQWSAVWGGSATEHSYSVKQTSDGGYIVTGSTSSFGSGGDDVFLLKYDSTGALSWNTVWGGTNSDVGRSVIQTSDGGYAVAGNTLSFGSGSGDALVAKFTSFGSLSWNKTWGDSSTEVAQSIAQTSDSGYIVGLSGASGGLPQAYLLKLDQSGAVSWARQWSGVSGDAINQAIQTSDGGYAVTGYTQSFAIGNSDMFIAKYDSSGTLSWSKVWGGSLNDVGNSIIQTSDGGYAVAGTTSSFGGGGSDAFLVKYDSSGTLSWNHTFGGSSTEDGTSLIQTSDGGYVLAGDVGSFGLSTLDVLLARFDSSGAISGCSTTCGTPSATTSSPSATSGSPSKSVTTPSATTSSPSATTSNPTATQTVIVALAPSTIDIGSALASQNTSATIPADGQPFRLRIDVAITNFQLGANLGSLKLQYAPMTTSCDASFSNTPSSAYKDVTDISTVRYYDNSNGRSGLLPSTNANDPTDGSNTLVRQTYREKGTTNFTNPSLVSVGQDAMWDFALTTDHTVQGTHYCLRIVTSGGTAFSSYLTASSTSAVAEIITPSSTYTQSNYRLFNPGSKVPTFLESWGGSSGDQGMSVAATSDGGSVIAGSTNSFGTAGDAFLAKYDSLGALTWSRTWGGSGNDVANSVIQSSDGGYVVIGNTTSSFSAGLGDAFILKYDSSGTLTWNKTWGGTNEDNPYKVRQTTDGGYVVVGRTLSFGAGSYDAFILKYDSSGTLTWNKTWGGTGDDEALGVGATSDGGFVVTGLTQSFGVSTSDVFLAKYDSSGTLTWNKTWGGPSTDAGESVIQTSDGGYAVVAQPTDLTGTSYDSALLKYDSSGNLSWNRLWYATTVTNEQATDLVQTSDGGYALVGTTNSFGVGLSDIFLIRYNSTGTLLWGRTWGTSSVDSASGLALSTDGGFLVVGSEPLFGAGSGDAFLAKYDASGNINGCGSACTVPLGLTTTITTTGITTPSATVGAPSVVGGTPSATTSSPSITPTFSISLAYSSSVGTPLVAQSTPYDDVKVGSEFRLRLDVDFSGSGTSSSGQSFKLQYALRGSDLVCDTSFTNETYADVSTTTPIYYYDDPNNASADGVSWSLNDPTSGSNLLSPQTFRESNNFTNAMTPVYSGESGEWDFSLAVKSGTQPGNDYCLRVVTSGGSTISYSQIVDIGYGPSMMNLMRQEAWFNRSGVRQNFFIKGQ